MEQKRLQYNEHNLLKRKVIGPSVTITVVGEKRFYRCECGCNVFAKIEPIDPDWILYRCNSCRSNFEGQPIDKIPKDVELAIEKLIP